MSATKVKEVLHPDSVRVLESFDRLPDVALIQVQVVSLLLCCSAPTIWRGVRAGRIPKPIKVTGGVTRWRVGDIRTWLNGQIKGA